MKEHTKSFIINYVKNPFIVWGIFVIVTGRLNHISEIYELREFIWINLLHIPIFWMMATYVGCSIHAPLWDAFKKLSYKKMGLAVFMMVGLGLTVAVEHPFFFLGIMELIAEQHKEIITDQLQFDQATRTAFVMVYFLIPLSTYFLLDRTRNQLEQRNFRITKTLRDYPLEFVICMTLAFVFSSIFTILLNNQII